MRIPRFRVRTLMLGVLVVAMLIVVPSEILRMRRRSAYFRWAALGHAANAKMSAQRFAKIQLVYESMEPSRKGTLEGQLLASDLFQKYADIAAQINIAFIFEHAAAHPWEGYPWFAEPPNMPSSLKNPEFRRVLDHPSDPAAFVTPYPRDSGLDFASINAGRGRPGQGAVPFVFTYPEALDEWAIVGGMVAAVGWAIACGVLVKCRIRRHLQPT